MTKESRQWKGKTGGGSFGQKSLFFIFKFVDVTIIYPTLLLVVPFYMLFNRTGYLSIIRYFKQAYNMSSMKAFMQTFKNHLIFGQVVLDKFAIIAGRKNFFSTEVEGEEYIKELLSKKTGFIIASSHIGNFEAGGFVTQQDVKKIHALIYDGESEAIMKKRKQTLKDVNINAISVKKDMSHLFLIKQALENGEIITIPCDRVYGSNKNINRVFLGKEASFPLAPFRLAAQMNVPIVALFMMKDSAKKYHAYINPIEVKTEVQNIAKKAELLATEFIRKCEEIVLKYPHQWFNFYNFWATENIQHN
ncbi:lysophospholipid acyltransferase family protein [Odoribacter sp. OttesenSCG-928-L07]|nr:lysophospholipid acyltransferase family protein [Odoribacter sp. OttesenSCG-928-L07]MDL2238891.1 lysophospholipid acyltransferase family protein [Bacteroidales bacterium OttesenSCG-928-L14]MDL2240631.1 lysophospholipid acyltransferase family protein [Bacteroidales bacterium OttesenSCG-928-K22]